MSDGQRLAEFEAQVATEALAPLDFFRGVRQLFAQGQTTPEGAEALRLAYLANPLNANPDKEHVREFPLAGLLDAGTEGEPAPPPPTESPPRREGQGVLPAADGGLSRPTELLAGLRHAADMAEVEDALGTWKGAQAAFQAGEWAEARRLTQVIMHLPEYERPARDLHHAIDRHEDFVLPELQGLAAGLASAARREAWQDIDQIWERAQGIVAEQHRRGLPTRLPPTLVEQYSRAKNAQQAQPLVELAIDLRRRGEFVQSDSLLAEAVRLDPDNAVILAERERCSQGTAKLASLQSLLGRAHVSVDELIRGVEDAASLELLAPDGEPVVQAARRFRRLRDETVERLVHRAEQLLEEIDRRAGLGEKWSLSGEASRTVDELLRLAPERTELVLLEERLERRSGEIARAQDLSQGLAAALEGGREGEALSPIQAGRLVGDLKEAAAIASDDLSLRILGARIAEAISLSLSSPTYLLRETERFDIPTFYNAKELVRLLSECPGNPGARTVEGYRHALLTKGAQAVVARLERGLAPGSASGAQSVVEEAFQLAVALSSLPGAESLGAATELAERVTAQVRRWVHLRLLGAQTLEDVARATSEVADMLVYLRSLPGAPAEAHGELESELMISVQQAIRRHVGPEVLESLALKEAAARVGRAGAFVNSDLPIILQRLARPERARSVGLLEGLALAEQHLAQRQGRLAMIKTAGPVGGAMAGVVAVLLIAIIAVPSLRPGIGVQAPEGRVFRPEPSLAGIQGYDCDHVDGHNICDVPLGPQFKSHYRDPLVRARLGPPLSSSMREAGDVQYFQHGRLEHHPQNSSPYDYQFGLLGSAVAARRAGTDPALRAALAPVSSDANRGRYYLQTGHHVGDRSGFLRFFEARGAIYTFGYPVSEEFETSDGRVIQYFQSARFEGRMDDPSSVRLGNLGVEYLREILGAKLCHRLLDNLTECG